MVAAVLQFAWRQFSCNLLAPSSSTSQRNGWGGQGGSTSADWASGLSRQVSMLLYCLREDTEDVLLSMGTTDTDQANCDAVQEKFESFFRVRRNIIYEHTRFNRQMQQGGETVHRCFPHFCRKMQVVGHERWTHQGQAGGWSQRYHTVRVAVAVACSCTCSWMPIWCWTLQRVRSSKQPTSHRQPRDPQFQSSLYHN